MKAPLTTQNVDCSYDIRRGAIPERILFNIWTLDLREWLGGSDLKMTLLPFLDIYRRGKSSHVSLILPPPAKTVMHSLMVDASPLIYVRRSNNRANELSQKSGTRNVSPKFAW